MKSTITRIAAAAVIIIAVLVGINPVKPSITFAEVVEPILNARTIIYDFFIGDEATGLIMHFIIVDQRIRRTFSNMPGMTHIIDPESSQMLILTDEDKTAAYVDISGPYGERMQSHVKFLKQAITNLEDNFEELGEQEIEGRKTIAFLASGPNERVKIWADSETALPVRIELTVGQMFVVMKNFQFDAEADESLVRMEVPDGYTLQKNDIALGNGTEEDFIQSLRVWAEIIRDGTFPEAIGSKSAMKDMPTLVQKVSAMQVSEEQGMQISTSFARGMLFQRMLASRGIKWNYAGAGVKLGDASKAIYWYQPQGSETWRVIYGDLRVEDVAEENLPQ